jgi:hypothetical protein
MKQPTYSPQEALERVKLMMGYDMSKTLTENRETIKQSINEDTAGAAVGGTLASAGAGAAYGGLATAGALGGLNTAAAGASFAVGSALLPASAGMGTAVALGAGILAGAAGLAVVPLAYWLIRKDSGSASSVKKLFQMCSSDASKIAKLPRKMNDAKIRNLADDINDAVNYQTLGFMAGTDEDLLFKAFRSLRDGTASDACALVNRYNSEYGDLYDDIDSDIDSPDEWKQIYRPLRDCIEDSLLTIKDDDLEEDCKKNPKQPKCGGMTDDEKIRKAKACGHKTWEAYKASGWKCKKGGGGGGSSFKPCKGTYTYLCMADAIKTVQACLGLTADGKWGNKTQAKLKSLGYSSFTDADVQKICGKKTDVEGETIDVSGEDKKISTSDTNF